MLRLVRLAIPALIGLGLLAGCSGDGEELRVFAAASLTDVMPRLVEGFREQYPSTDVEVAYGGSQALASQIEEGAPADVFVSADVLQAQRLIALDLAADRLDLARNALVVAVAAGSAIDSIEDLGGNDVRVALGAPGVPVGELTLQALAQLPAAIAAEIRKNVITEDPNVRAVLSRVELGEADAGFVYRTDVTSASGLRAVELAGALGTAPETTYVVLSIAEDDPPSEDADRFLAYLGGPEAAAILRAAGFEPIVRTT